ncbi:hypothetical protein E8E15_007836 [Penicillium rubens]|nr:hypothetical protein E8E15_007836 [Penicillium rubens]
MAALFPITAVAVGCGEVEGQCFGGLNEVRRQASFYVGCQSNPFGTSTGFPSAPSSYSYSSSPSVFSFFLFLFPDLPIEQQRFHATKAPFIAAAFTTREANADPAITANVDAVTNANAQTRPAGLEPKYPSKTNNSGAVELYAIACAMKFALDNIGHTAFAVSSKGCPQSSHSLPGNKRTMSHTHIMKREVILFTDDWYALQRLNSTLANPVGGPYGPLLKAICDLSQLLAQNDVHLELHWSPDHADIPGNEAAHDMSEAH